MLLVIFGAGASYDASSEFPPDNKGESHPSRLPLADRLFDKRDLFKDVRKEFPACLPILSLLQNVNVETKLEELLTEGKERPRRLEQIAAVKFYLQEALWRCESKWREQGLLSNYATLLDEIEQCRWRAQTPPPRYGYQQVLLATFNYDTLLEYGFYGAFERRLDSLDAYVAADSPYKIVKLHGSTTWIRVVNSTLTPGPIGAQVQELIRRNADPKLEISDSFSAAAPGVNPFRSSPIQGTGFPAIAIPTKTKDRFECPQAHLEVVKRSLPLVTRILVVGWSAGDHHFLELLKEVPQYIPCYLACGDRRRSEGIAEKIKERNSFDFHNIEKGFSDLITSGKMREPLTGPL